MKRKKKETPYFICGDGVYCRVYETSVSADGDTLLAELDLPCAPNVGDVLCIPDSSIGDIAPVKVVERAFIVTPIDGAELESECHLAIDLTVVRDM